jgi:hypothetical protein
MLAGELALTIAAVFTGAAIYINIAEQPARLQLDNRSLLAEWKPAYKRATSCRRALPSSAGSSGSSPISAPSTGVGCLEPSSCWKLALHDLHDHADQQASHGHAAGGRHGRNAPHARAMGHSPCRAKCSWPRGDPDLSMGPAVKLAADLCASVECRRTRSGDNSRSRRHRRTWRRARQSAQPSAPGDARRRPA